MKNKLNIITALILGLILTVTLFGQGKYQVRITDNLAENKSVSKQNGTLRERLERDFQEIGLQPLFDSSFQDIPLEDKLEKLKTTTRIDLLLKQNQLDIAILEDKTIIIFQDTPINRVRIEKMEIRKYKLNYLQAENLKSILPDILPKERRFFHAITDRNTLLVTGSLLDHIKIKALVEALDFQPVIIDLGINFYEVSNDKQNDILGNLNSQNALPGSLSFLPINSLALNNKNIQFIGQVNLPMLNGRQSSIKVGQKVPVKQSSFYNPQVELPLTPTNLVGKIVQTLLPNQTADNNATYSFEESGLELIATPNLQIDSAGLPKLNLTFEFKNNYAEAERVNSPIFRNVELKTSQILPIGEPVLAASWDIKRTTKENRPMIFFIPLPGKTVKTNRKSMMTLTARLKNDSNIVQSLTEEANLEEKLHSIFSVEILSQLTRQTRPRIIIP